MHTSSHRSGSEANLSNFESSTSLMKLWREADLLGNRPLLDDEFPQWSAESTSLVGRREFLQAMGVSLAIASAAGCGRERSPRILSESLRPEEQPADRVQFLATVMTLGGFGQGVLAEQHAGRPTKLEGNPDHPASLGATDIFCQAAIAELYDPDRSDLVLHQGQRSTWSDAFSAIADRLSRHRSNEAGELRVLTETVTSPTLSFHLQRLVAEIPRSKWYQYEPLSREAVRAGAKLAFGVEVEPVYHLDKADLILALDADLLGNFPGRLRYVREFANRRRVWSQDSEGMNRLYAVGPHPTLTSAAADHRLALRGSDVEIFAAALAREMGIEGSENFPAASEPWPKTWFDQLVDDLLQHRGRSLIVAGETQPPRVHALVHALNDALGNVSKTVYYIPPVEAPAPSGIESFQQLVQEMRQGEVDTLFIIGGNPVYSSPADLEFSQALARVPFRVHSGLWRDESANACHWHLPAAHFLESWGDALAFDGTASIQQPVMNSLVRRGSPLQLVSALLGERERSDLSLIRERWRERWQERPDDPEELWQRSLHEGVIPDSRFPPQDVRLQAGWQVVWESSSQRVADDPSTLEVIFRPDPTILDGRFANNLWLQELPKPLTSVTWDNVAVFGPATAARLGLHLDVGSRGGEMVADVVRLTYRGRTLEAPAWIMPGHAEESVTLFLGYGRSAGGRFVRDRGYNAFLFRTSENPWHGLGLQVEKVSRRYELAATQLHHRMQGRDLVRAETWAEYRKNSAPARHTEGQTSVSPLLPIIQSDSVAPGGSLYPEQQYTGYRWGMVIDLNACMGCGACVLACQAENSIPAVGKEEVLRGREMHWLRVDAYHQGDAAQPEATYFQPVPCMHCEKAPCEVVCPVNATVHSDEGLNDMNYARCIGTRYCSNNCPYKVRRFNYYPYAEWTDGLRGLNRNPDVTVRSRGVMEKCTYCVQRINEARIHAQKDNRPLFQNRAGEWMKPIYPGELLTACQAVCPAQAIVFGDLNDPSSQVSRMRYEQPLNYGLLDQELGTRPRTTYLSALRNRHDREAGA